MKTYILIYNFRNISEKVKYLFKLNLKIPNLPNIKTTKKTLLSISSCLNYYQSPVPKHHVKIVIYLVFIYILQIINNFLQAR